MAERRLFFLGWLNSTGFREDGWSSHPEIDRAAIWRLEHYLESARIARDAGFAALFLSDRPWIGGDDERPEYPIDPIVLLSALLPQVEGIGGIATISSTLTDPYAVARQAAGVQQLSGGRFGINVVTSIDPRVAANFGVDLPDRATRYARAAEHAEVLRRLWGSWRFDWSRASDPAYDPHADRTPIAFEGEHVRVAGALGTPRTPWGDPVIAQAGGSDEGLAFGAAHGDLFYTFLGGEADGVAWRARLRQAAAALGRDPEQLLVAPTLQPLVGSTEAEVARLVADFEASLGDPEAVVASTARSFGIDLAAGYDPEAPLRAEDVAFDPASRTPLGVLRAQVNRALEEGLSLREIALRGNVVAGTPEQVAAFVERRWRAGAADGFVVNSPTLPQDLRTFAEQVVPVLVERGAYSTERRGEGLREQLGLDLGT